MFSVYISIDKQKCRTVRLGSSGLACLRPCGRKPRPPCGRSGRQHRQERATAEKRLWPLGYSAIARQQGNRGKPSLTASTCGRMRRRKRTTGRRRCGIYTWTYYFYLDWFQVLHAAERAGRVRKTPPTGAREPKGHGGNRCAPPNQAQKKRPRPRASRRLRFGGNRWGSVHTSGASYLHSCATRARASERPLSA